ncbi:hypothetical protein LTR84_009045 [Exophiala bonariae]|uniref:Uncharacterized protein n=1 Tax=Exophiala bonariae TaxID=1690606 RepID=A0AAV9MZ77_9EURO|nr:hypothetical protein LTR84_009045 [Exophiala bonariae]
MPLVVRFMGRGNLTTQNTTMTLQNPQLDMTSKPLLSLPKTWRPISIQHIHRVRDMVSSLTGNSTLPIRKNTGPKPLASSNSTMPSDNNPGTMQHISDLAIPFFTVLLMLLFITALVGLALKAPDWTNIHNHTRNAMPVLTIRDCPRRRSSHRPNSTRSSSMVSTSRGSTGRHHRFGHDVDIEAARAMARVRELTHDDNGSYASDDHDADADVPMARDSLVPVPNYGGMDRPGQEFWRHVGWDGMAY